MIVFSYLFCVFAWRFAFFFFRKKMNPTLAVLLPKQIECDKFIHRFEKWSAKNTIKRVRENAISVKHISCCCYVFFIYLSALCENSTINIYQKWKLNLFTINILLCMYLFSHLFFSVFFPFFCLSLSFSFQLPVNVLSRPHTHHSIDRPTHPPAHPSVAVAVTIVAMNNFRNEKYVKIRTIWTICEMYK